MVIMYFQSLANPILIDLLIEDSIGKTYFYSLKKIR